MRSNHLLKQILLIAIAQLITVAIAGNLSHMVVYKFDSSNSSSDGADFTDKYDDDNFKPKLIKLDEWVVADLNTSALVNNVSLLVTKLNNYTGGVVNTFGLFHTELMAFRDVLNQTINITKDIHRQLDKMSPNKVILDILVPIVDDFEEKMTRSVDQLRTVVDDYYNAIKFGTEESYERVTFDLKNDLNDVLIETESTPNSTLHGQMAVMDLVDYSHIYYNQFENGLRREAIALSEYRRVLVVNNNRTLQTMNDSIIFPFFNCENTPDNKTVACLQDVYKNGSSVNDILNLHELIEKFEVRFRERRTSYVKFIDDQTDSAVELFAKTMKTFYEFIGKLKDDGAPSCATTSCDNVDATMFILTLAITLCLLMKIV